MTRDGLTPRKLCDVPAFERLVTTLNASLNDFVLDVDEHHTGARQLWICAKTVLDNGGRWWLVADYILPETDSDSSRGGLRLRSVRT